MVLRLAGQLSEHLVDTEELRDTHVELERLVHTLPPGRYQRDSGPSQWLLRMLATQTERTALVPLIDALHRRMREQRVIDFGMQMASAARLASRFPQVGEQLRQRYRVVLLDEYQDTGHAQRVALSSLFGGGVDDGLALTAVGDPIQSIYGWRGASATNLPRFTTDFPRRTAPRRPAWSCAPVGATRPRCCTWPTRCRWMRGTGRWRCGRCCRVPTPTGDTCGARCCPTWRPNANGWPSNVAPGTTRASATPARRRPRRFWCAATPTPRRWPKRSRRRGVAVEVVGLAGLLSVPEVADVVAMLRLAADPTAGPRRCACSPALAGGWAPPTSPRCGVAR